MNEFNNFRVELRKFQFFGRSFVCNVTHIYLVLKPSTFWYGKLGSSNEENDGTLKRESSHFGKSVQHLTDQIMDDKWIPLSRRCAILVDSSLKLWTVFTFAMLSIVLLFYEVSFLNIQS